MDGYHYYRSELDAMENSEEAHKRRGAPFTFNAKSLINLIQSIRNQGDQVIHAPSFDHALKDPKENDIPIHPKNRIVIVEGNYLLLKEEPWSLLTDPSQNLLDEAWFIDCDLDVSMKRVVERHKKAWGWDNEMAEERVNSNDRLNAVHIIQNSVVPHKTIYSK
eukprot:TRINITY_DN4602_c0_g2_i5.p1 TRINITY_DN4602_c0_g2~~TRINITY_DN4602_c0_g2_i5.p1  ORF type:complete len:163 (+),score=69.87 TRINITY_DN4602_c0_g2_i5:361-849(+)